MKKKAIIFKGLKVPADYVIGCTCVNGTTGKTYNTVSCYGATHEHIYCKECILHRTNDRILQEYIQHLESQIKLEDFMVVELRNNETTIVAGDRLLFKDGYLDLCEYNTDMCCEDESDFDIMSIYEPNPDPESLNEVLDVGDLLWQRYEPITVVLDSIKLTGSKTKLKEYAEKIIEACE